MVWGWLRLTPVRRGQSDGCRLAPCRSGCRSLAGGSAARVGTIRLPGPGPSTERAEGTSPTRRPPPPNAHRHALWVLPPHPTPHHGPPALPRLRHTHHRHPLPHLHTGPTSGTRHHQRQRLRLAIPAGPRRARPRPGCTLLVLRCHRPRGRPLATDGREWSASLAPACLCGLQPRPLATTLGQPEAHELPSSSRTRIGGRVRISRRAEIT